MNEYGDWMDGWMDTYRCRLGGLCAKRVTRINYSHLPIKDKRGMLSPNSHESLAQTKDK